MKSDADFRVMAAQFEAGLHDARGFNHAEHVRLAYEYMMRFGFADTLPRFARGLRRTAARAGHPEMYHETLTTAFLALIAERVLVSTAPGFGTFAEEHPEIFDRHLVRRLYAADRLDSDLARRTFLMPKEPAHGT